LLDPHRFARGIKPQPDQVRSVTVRRLKQDLVNEDGSPVFPKRVVKMLEVEHPDSEREVHAKLAEYARLRAQRLGTSASATTAADFITTLLKKRLFSSPAAFLRTLEVHEDTLKRTTRPEAAPTQTVLQRLFDDANNSIDDEASEDGVGDATREAIDAAAATERSHPTQAELDLLDEMIAWAEPMANREDARTTTLLDWVEQQVKPEGEFTDERVIVFTEYRATQRYLQERLSVRGIAGERVALLDGTTGEDQREEIKSRWQEPPAAFPVRLLLATDAASEGISLQRQCHLLAHAEIPWNPNRLEQRNGRIDRHGQTANEVLVYHTVSAGWETAQRGSIEGDLDFLARVVVKVHQIREDLGSAGPVIAAQIEEAMLGHRKTLDDTRFASGTAASRAVIQAERRMRERLGHLRDELAASRTTLHLQPDRIQRVVATALDLARQPALQPGEEPGTFVVPALTASWSRAIVGLEHPAHPDVQRPITFDPDIAKGRTDLVLAHLGHPLVDLATALLRKEVWGQGGHLNRVTVRYADRSVGVPTAVAHGRLVITGATGHRLHEELIFAGLKLTPTPERLGVQDTERVLAAGRDRPVPSSLSDRLILDVQAGAPALRSALQTRAQDRARQLTTTLENRAVQDQEHIAATLNELAETIRREAFGESGDQMQLITGLELDAGDRAQVERDRESLAARLDAIPGEIKAEQAAIAHRYADPTHRLFPAAVMLLVPEGVQL
jgi:hypothetical protein